MNEKLIYKLKNSSGKDEFFEELKKFFEDNYNELFFEIVNLVPIPPFYLPLSESQNIVSLLKEFSNCSETNHKDNFVLVNSYFVYPLTEEKESSKYLLVFDNQIDNYFDEITSLCDSIRDIFKIAINNFNFGFNDSALENANLISQMNHDINSMISLIKSNLPEIDTSVSDKMNYTEKMTKDILQYVREIQILESEVNIAELLNSVIQNISIPKNIQLIKKYDLNSKSISVDVELIDRAIGEIIKNSISALNNAAGKINIIATINDFENLFTKNQFLVISIEDNGKGINPDFLEFVTNPFFTTNKSEYHCGLGLSNANKIIEAHGGNINIQINQENNTLVTIYLPVQGKENE
jgi:signal transduction histidine kinase